MIRFELRKQKEDFGELFLRSLVFISEGDTDFNENDLHRSTFGRDVPNVWGKNHEFLKYLAFESLTKIDFSPIATHFVSFSTTKMC